MEALEGLKSAVQRWQSPQPIRPFVTLSYAQSLDGSLTREQGTPTPLSSPLSLQLTHQLRAFHDALLIGSGTLLADDPQLTARDVPGEQPQPIVLDRRLRFPDNARLLEHPKPPWVFCDPHADSGKTAYLKKRGCQVFQLSDYALHAVLQTIAAQGIRSTMIEGGGEILTSFLQAGLADYAVITIAPRYLGGYNALRAQINTDANANYPELTDVRSYPLGSDLIVEGRILAANS